MQADDATKPRRGPAIPAYMADLPVDFRGFVIPWFVAWMDGKPDHRIADAPKIGLAVEKRLCWLCGKKLGDALAFVIGPMCSINRISSEPPSHPSCANYAVQACPFLSQPKMRRSERGLEHAGIVDPPGIMEPRNPGVTLIWLTPRYKLIPTATGVLFEIGTPSRVEWWTEGRRATVDEAFEAFTGGASKLFDAAEPEGLDALIELGAMTKRASKFLPKAT